MNFERGFLTPRHGNGDSCSFVTQGMPIPRDSRIGHSQDAWTTTMLQGSEVVGGGEYMVTPRPIPVDNGIVSGRESQNTINPQHPTSMGNGVAANRDKQATTTKKTMLLRNGIVQNANDWNSVIPGNSFPSRKGNGIDQSKNSWTPVTPEKLINERPNTIGIDTQENRLGNENWQDLIGMYTNLLQEETLDLKGLIAPPPMIHKNGNQNWVASTTKRDLNPRPSPSTYPDHTSNQASTSLSYFDTNDPANWNGNLLATNVGSNRNSTCISPANEAQNNGILASNRPLIPNPSTQVGSNHKNSGYIRSMLGSQQTQNFTPNGVNKVISNQDNAKDSFPVRYQPCYSPSSPPGSAPDAASSSIMGTFPFATITPDNQRKHIDNQWLPENVNFPVEETSTPAKDRHANQTVPIADTENLYNELFRTIGDSPSSAISTTQKIRVISEDGDEQGIDLNNTPQQKTPARRKKHRPKVIREGKPKRTPKPEDPRKGTSNEARVKRKYVKKKDVGISETQHGDGAASVGKRKYVRKKGIDNLGSQQKSRVDDVVTSVVETPAKSCKKQLNFDLECVAKHESHDIGGRQQGTNANVNPQDIEQERRVNSMLETSAMKITQQNKYMAETMQGGNQYTLPELNVPTTPLAKARGHTLNVLARNITMRNFVPGENRQENKYNQVNQHVHGEGITNMVFEASNPQFFASKGMLSFDERRGIKRQNSEQMYHRNVNAMDSLPLYQKLLLGVAHRTDYSNNLSSIFLENHKKTKMRSEFQALISSEPSCIAPLEDKLRQEARQMNGIYGNTSAMQLLNSCTERVHPTHKAMNVGANVSNRQFRPPMAATHDLLKHQVLSGMQPHTIRSVAERSQNYTPGHEISSVLAMVKWNSLPPAPPKEASRYAITTCPATLLEKKQSTKSYPYNQRLNGLNEMLPQHSNYALDGHHRSSTIAKGPARRQKAEVSVDYVTYKLEGLRIYEENEKEQNALVLYRGSKAIIPFEPIKKRNPRPKVDLDPETERLWKLLMGKEGSEGAETLDKDKEKWWEDERRVFRGRADSFIARMHLVQGDRRFSRWKGSVVDSVIGVFLTQNVSDHLSSSAFMSLAAKFPLKSTTTSETSCQDGACEGPIEVAEPNDIMKCHEKIRRNSVSDQSSFASCESSENMACHISSTRSAANKHSRISEEEVILSQDSFDSSTIQTVDEIRSSSGSNSEAEDVTIGFETSKQSGTPLNLIQTEKPTVFKDHSHHHNWSTLLDEQATNMHRLPKEPVDDMQIPRMNGVDLNNSSRFTPANSSIHFLQESLALSSQFQVNVTPGSQKVGSLHFRMLEGESASSLPSSSSGITEAYHTSNVTYPQNQMPTFQAPTLGQQNLLSSHPAHQENFQPGPHVGSSQLLNTSHQQETKTRGHAETLGKGINGAQKEDSAMFGGITINVEGRISVADKQNCLENTVAEANSKQQNYAFHEPPSGAGTNMSKARKGTAEDEKNRATDWDSLRKQVLSNGEKRKQSKDATDSLDYEALRRANVNEISDAIRERGMNNLLADRIKEFLNRLVRDHGKIDLEWLRDAPPDKAKDYLLSFRGLGLKSVECVRLLTLHHLAFPVDTNVGRIAVRLGWVPLQPLPESLQLHLLEMYPVLESIQKYLWPRLCKLDQLTLYELHYQMITFGKVFCTKSKPNCNACPMRAECRHFASAFASARLALPGPDEKRIVTSDAPIATDPTPPVVIRPMPLPRSEDDYNKNAEVFGKNCEPIIEEPTTPEPETTELSISDIEDQYYEDSDEIPSIKLNMVEFTTNLQNIMQDNMELQDNMSKALVALNPNAASIPTPKLKDVSRLRTEHQVYELPDSHQLLEGLDKREPDDPSPYLLAIWTPGETANSVQPPERECSAQESGKLCDKTTCFSCNSIKEANTHVVRGTILIPCRTAMQGSFPLNGTYFQVNEMFADHASSLNPIDVPRSWIWNLPRRTVYFGTSVSTIFKGLTTEGIQYCFWKGFVCVRGFDQKTRAPRPLMARLHFPASKLVKTKNGGK